MPGGIQMRGPHQFRVQVRRNGVYETKTSETLREAQDWQWVAEGKVTGEEFVDRKLARGTTLAQACNWMLEGGHVGSRAGCSRHLPPSVTLFRAQLPGRNPETDLTRPSDVRTLIPSLVEFFLAGRPHCASPPVVFYGL